MSLALKHLQTHNENETVLVKEVEMGSHYGVPAGLQHMLPRGGFNGSERKTSEGNRRVVVNITEIHCIHV